MRFPPLWRISACAALLGLGQNGLLVALPVLVERFGLPLSQWAGLILLGSMLFLLGSPFWGRIADRHGARGVVIQALLGYVTSFALIGFALWTAAHGWLGDGALLALVAAARVLYGLTVSGMVPACQQWSLALHDGEERVKALAAISAGLSSGRLLGPLIAAASLSLSAHAPFVVMLLCGMLALLLLRGIPAPTPQLPSAASRAARLPRGPLDLLPCLAIALLLAMSASLMQLGLPGALQGRLDIDATRAGHLMGILLSLGALGALTIQLGITRHRRLSGYALLALGALGLVTGYGVLTMAIGPASFGLGIMIASVGAALAVPGYTDAATRQRSPGASAGLLAMAHTLGYGAATLTVSLAAAAHLLPLSLAAACVLLLFVPMTRNHFRIMPATSRITPTHD
ncbi:MFS transporter [Halomonas daqingensis]|uniref:MFS transporter n=3 Tax=Billgrantia desiderata TaxID=52021 RepID=A0AAW4YRY2_9GAMM|nr:MFS transporter [Halomonas desiderata]MCE8051427.1 MFS transporter [Halomonas desiderata]